MQSKMGANFASAGYLFSFSFQKLRGSMSSVMHGLVKTQYSYLSFNNSIKNFFKLQLVYTFEKVFEKVFEISNTLGKYLNTNTFNS